MKKPKDNPTDAQVKVLKRKSEVKQPAVQESKKRKKHLDQNKISADGPKNAEDMGKNTKILGKKAQKLQKSKKQDKGIKLQEGASLPQGKQEKDSSLAKKVKKKLKKPLPQIGAPIVEYTSNTSEVTAKNSKKQRNKNINVKKQSDSTGTEMKLKKTKSPVSEQNLVKRNGVLPKSAPENSVINGSELVKKKKKNKKNKHCTDESNKEISVNNGFASVKKNKKNKHLTNEKVEMSSGGCLPASFQKNIKPKQNNKIEKSSPAGKETFSGKIKKKKVRSPKKFDASNSSKEKSQLTEKETNEMGENGSQTQILSLKGKALKRHVTNLRETIAKLRQFSDDQAAHLLKSTTPGKTRRIKDRIKKVKGKIAQLEADLAVYQKNPKFKTKEILNNMEFIGLPQDPPKAKKKDKPVELKDFLQKQMKASRFRWLNENLYTSSSEEAQGFFKDDPESFNAYHEGYSEQVAKWPVNPLNVIITELKSLPEETVVADLGCGEAKLAAALPKLKVHSLDFIAIKPEVIACDMAHCPLLRSSVDVAVFCLSLMGTNISDFLLEANRILKKGGTMEIAEVESRFESVDDFIEKVKKYGFELKKKVPMDMFFFLSFTKTQDVNRSKKLPDFELKACVYKKR